MIERIVFAGQVVWRVSRREPGDARLACLWQWEKKRAAGVVVRRLVLAPRGLTGLLNPSVKSGTKLFQPYFMNCFNCASPAVPLQQ
jgi:hypothetical protein